MLPNAGPLAGYSPERRVPLWTAVRLFPVPASAEPVQAAAFVSIPKWGNIQCHAPYHRHRLLERGKAKKLALTALAAGRT